MNLHDSDGSNATRHAGSAPDDSHGWTHVGAFHWIHNGGFRWTRVGVHRRSHDFGIRRNCHDRRVRYYDAQ